VVVFEAILKLTIYGKEMKGKAGDLQRTGSSYYLLLFKMWITLRCSIYL
jgi:hypothetical protein